MPKKDMTREELQLYNIMQKLIKQANMRIMRLEKETGLKNTFATRQLIDYLSSAPLNAITKSGRISRKKDYTLMQQKAIIKATKEFLEKNESRVKGIKEYKAKFTNITGKKLNYKMANTFYNVTHDLSSWLYDSSMTESVFWRDFAPLVKTTPKDDWVELVSDYKEKVPDRKIKQNLEMLYDYLKVD